MKTRKRIVRMEVHIVEDAKKWVVAMSKKGYGSMSEITEAAIQSFREGFRK